MSIIVVDKRARPSKCSTCEEFFLVIVSPSSSSPCTESLEPPHELPHHILYLSFADDDKLHSLVKLLISAIFTLVCEILRQSQPQVMLLRCLAGWLAG